MEELELSKELYYNILSWMKPKYAMGTVHERALLLKRLFKKYGVLNQETLRKMVKTFKYQHQRAVISMINTYCYENNINFNIIVPTIKAQSRKLPEILSPNEIKLMISSVPYPYNLAIRCIFNMGAGLRISELIKFSWNHIRWIDWISDKSGYGVAIIKSGKGSKDRVVNIPSRLMNDLYTFAKEEDVLNEFGIPTGGMIFPFGFKEKQKNFKPNLMAANIERWKYEYVRCKYNWFRYNILKKYCEKALNKHIKIHSLRHSRATYLYEVEGVPVEKIQILLGHSSLNTTMLYTKINPKGVFEMLKNTNEI
jgi:integrase